MAPARKMDKDISPRGVMDLSTSNNEHSVVGPIIRIARAPLGLSEHEERIVDAIMRTPRAPLDPRFDSSKDGEALGPLSLLLDPSLLTTRISFTWIRTF